LVQFESKMITLCHIFPKKSGWQKIFKKMNFWCFSDVFCWQWISRNCINVYLLCKFNDNRIQIDDLTHKNLLIFIEQKIFEKSFLPLIILRREKYEFFCISKNTRRCAIEFFSFWCFCFFNFFIFHAKLKLSMTMGHMLF